jgi:hypothetical protein
MRFEQRRIGLLAAFALSAALLFPGLLPSSSEFLDRRQA